MIRHDWTLALGLGICSSLMSGCLGESQARSNVEVNSALEKTALPVETAPAAKAQPQVQPQVQPEIVQIAEPPCRLQPAQPAPVQPPIQQQAYVEPEPPTKPQSEPGMEIRPVAAPSLITPQATAEVPQPAVEAKAPPTPTDPPLIAALRCLLDQHSEEAITYLLKFDKPTQDLLLYLLPVVARLGTGSLEAASAADIAYLKAQIDSARGYIALRAPLVLERLSYCRDIDRFGAYDPLPEDYPFRPGEVGEVYVELQNVGTERHGVFFDIRLNGTVELRDAAGNTRPLRVLPGRRAADRSRSPRHDYYQSYRFCVPDNLRPGYYTLILHVTDAVTGRTAQKTLPLRVTTRPVSGQ